MRRFGLAILVLALAPSHSAFATPTPVVGGSDVPAGKWDDAAAVYFGGGGPACTGVLVAPNVVLTAGHCIGGVSRVMVGTNNLNTPGESINVMREIEYPSSSSSYDIGVLVLASNATTEPRVIATDCMRDQYIVDGGDVAVVGWGAINTNGSGETDAKQEAFTTINDHDCTDIQSGCNQSVSPNGEISAGGNGIDSCFGDSGGPLYLLTDKGDYLVGITSRGYNTGGQPCGQGGIYVRPDAVMDWIEEQSGVTLPRPVCNLAPEPTAPEIVVTAGQSETTLVAPNDPDVGDTHTFEVDVAPAHGEIAIAADGTVTYTADGDYDGPDSFSVAVFDSGSPALTASVLVQVEVLPAPGDCGCRTGGSPADAWPFVFVSLALLRGRRRS